MNLRNTAIAVASLTGALALAGSANAVIYTLSLTDAQGSLPAPYGQVEVTSPGTGTLNYTVTLFDGLKFTDTGAHYAFSFALVGEPTIGVTAPAGFSLVTNANSIANAPFGGFDYALDCAVTCAPNTGGYAGPLSFTVTGTGLTLASVGTANTWNGNVVRFAADTISQQGVTGTIGGGVPGVVPEPAAWGMMIVGFGMIGGLMRRRRQTGVLSLA